MTLILNHYTIRASDLGASRDFYEKVLGLTNGPRPAFSFPGAWMYRGTHDDHTNAVVHLIGIGPVSEAGEAPACGPPPGSGAIDHVAFSATGLGAMLTHLQKNNVPFQERTVPGLNLHQVFLHDPSGIKIELNYSQSEKQMLEQI